MQLICASTSSNLGSLDSTHLVDPTRSRRDLADGTDLVARIARDADVITTLEGELDITNLQNLATTFLGILAGSLKHLINEVVSDLKDGL